MTETSNEPTGPVEDTDREIEVWDIPTRLFHWSLVFQVFVALLTGYIFPEWWMETHIWAGHAIVILIGFRLVWGFTGSEFSRFDTFAFGPKAVIAHLKKVRAGKPGHFFGHNPAGGTMIYGLLVVLTILTLSGLVILGGEENQGAFAGWVGYAAGDVAKDLHGLLSILLIAMIAGHVGGVLMESKLTGENLIQTMIDGKKHVPAGEPKPRLRKPSVIWAALFSLIVIGGGTGTLNWMATKPPSGHVDLQPNETYAKNCDDCHWGFHPSLLPADSWQKIMHTLEDHFGEDAWLPPEPVGEINAWLTEYAAETWDTEAANRFRNVDPEQPRRITETPYWIRKHENVPESDYEKKSVNSKINCPACHKDAKTGRFDDQQIRIPKE